ncbi:MAG: peptide-methionine (S)-S-oxide reductase MsrA [Marinobacterium sp.]|nr:peptide-methionine (S)-S-oxide reductase MsrA [Marinobacterium sp.]
MPLATFAAGCFWGIEARFSAMQGVTDTTVGYMGGHIDNPGYRAVCTDTTGHAEVVQLMFDDSIISYEQLLDAFWQMHDPTTLNRQGPDAGSQYRSAIFYHDETQQILAAQSQQALDNSGLLPHPVVTEISPATTFWRAEEYHQKYLQKKGLPACGL